jgi:hypothetical protein
MSNMNRRAMLAGAAAVPAIGIAPTIALADKPDPIFAAIEKHRQIYAQESAVLIELNNAEEEVSTYRPAELVAWRDYSAIGSTELDAAREQFIKHALADVKTIDREYREKKRECCAKSRAGRDWDRKHGLAALRTRGHKLMRAEFAAREELSKIRPTTIAGATALIEYLHADMKEFKNCEDWHEGALVNVVTALKAVAA